MAVIINGKKITDRPFLPSVNPAHPRRSSATGPRARSQDAEAAVAAAVAYFPKWRATPVDERAKMLERAADLMESRRFEINSLLILEAGKPWVEADGDLSEAIDFCRFYAVEMRRLASPSSRRPCPASAASRRGRPAASASPSRRGISRSRSSPA
jgi:RHH-type proline utilization regulon transcriptional repressor/proline dehydrogenase/delta 1-pyrroline-5-carboxylate dehydrogenase